MYKRKWESLVIVMAMVLFLSGCDTSGTNSLNVKNENFDQKVMSVDSIDNENEIENNEEAQPFEDVPDPGVITEENLLMVEVTMLADFVGETTQEELDSKNDFFEYKSATLNEDGSVTYLMTKKQHEDMLQYAKEDVASQLDEMCGSDSLPNVTKIQTNDDLTEYSMFTTSETASLNEIFNGISFVYIARFYTSLEDKELESVRVLIINEESGEVLEDDVYDDFSELW